MQHENLQNSSEQKNHRLTLNSPILKILFTLTLAGAGYLLFSPEVVASSHLPENMPEYSHFGGEFDPTMGRELSTSTGVAFVVVHERFFLRYDRTGFYNSDPAYNTYLQELSEAKNEALERGDILVIVADRTAIENGEIALEPQPNVLYYITEPTTGIGAPYFVYNNILYAQYGSVESENRPWYPKPEVSVWQELKDAGVTKVVIAGEWRDRCPRMVAENIVNNSDLQIYWCDLCAYPDLDSYPDPEVFPMLPPQK